MSWPSRLRRWRIAPTKRLLNAYRVGCASWSLPSRWRARHRVPAYARRRRPVPDRSVCGGLDSLQIDYYSLYERYFAPKGIAMLTLDMPSIGFSSKWKLTQDSSLLHQHALKALENIPWVDHTRVAAFGFRFGANVAVRLAYLEASRLKAVACLGPVVHALLSDPTRRAACRKCTLMCWPVALACMMHQTKRCALNSIVTR